MVFRNILELLFMPPLLQLLLGAVAVCVWRRYRRLGRVLAIISVVSLWLLATPWFSQSLIRPLEDWYPAFDGELSAENRPGAIVILGGGRSENAPEYQGRDTVSADELVRLRYGARLQRQLNLPLLVTGGRVFDEAEAEADLMREVLETDFQVPVSWVERNAKTTYDNAVHSAVILEEAGVDKILLVTHANHMPRAVTCFEAQGLSVIPALTGYYGRDEAPSWLLAWMPTAKALYLSRRALHEWLGVLYYSVVYY